MQGVLLHAGAGLLQGAMGIHGAFVAGVPMVVISGESKTYGEQPEFDPGAQWINNLSIAGGTTHLVDSIVKYASVAGSVHTLYESVVRAGELRARPQWRADRLPVELDHGHYLQPADEDHGPLELERRHRYHSAGVAPHSGDEAATDRELLLWHGGGVRV